jgi:hypothetical protein
MASLEHRIYIQPDNDEPDEQPSDSIDVPVPIDVD